MKLDDKARAVYKRKEENKMYKAKLKGIEKGKKEGEKKKAIEIAKNLLDVLDIETISKKTGLSVEEIKELRDL